MRNKASFLIIVVLIAVCGALFINPIPQDPAYHAFVDRRSFLGVPNALDVLSNLPFFLVGLVGIGFIGNLLKQSPWNTILIQYLVFFIGVFLTSFGSAYYHYNPNNDTLVWDRLPMTIAFMAFFCSVISELINRKAGLILLVPLLLVGIGSVLYWDWTERQGIGDLRLYGLVQYLPIVLIPLIVCMYQSSRKYVYYIILLMFCYMISKGLELFDVGIYELVNHSISGHTLKHFFAAAGTYCILRMIYVRKDELTIRFG